MRGASGVNRNLTELLTIFITIPHLVSEGWSGPAYLELEEAWSGSFEDHLGRPCRIDGEDFWPHGGRQERVLHFQALAGGIPGERIVRRDLALGLLVRGKVPW